MSKPHIYIFQLIGILVLICCYLLGDKPDSLSLMYFNPSSPKVISSANHNMYSTQFTQNSISTEDGATKKMVSSKHISNEVILPKIIENTKLLIQPTIVHTQSFNENYYFLFFREINPPPPKC